MARDLKRIIMIAVALMVIGIIIPIAVGLIANAGNAIISTNTTVNATNPITKLSDVADASVVLMIEVLIPIIAVIAIVLMFLPTKKAS